MVGPTVVCSSAEPARLARAASGTVNQSAGQSFRIVEQDLQKMFGCELLVPLAQGERLRGLDETARTFGKFLKIHMRCPLEGERA